MRAMTLLRIDHLVVAVADPDGAADVLERELGLAFTGGGRHDRAGTFNRLAFLGDSYLELIGVFDRSLVAAGASFPVGRAALALLDEGREGFATWAIATDDCAAEAGRLRAAGSPIGEPVAGSRTRPDGEVVRWLTAFPPLGPGEPPFLIEHEPAGAEWGPGARVARAAFRHPAGGRLRLEGLALPVRDPGALADRYREVLGIEVNPGHRLAVGSQAVTLVRTGRDHPDAELPLVAIASPDPGVRAAELVRSGVRWRLASS
jgi:hypothetical protein